jgi:tRNA (cmo5U34)-methyltransferase
MNEFDLKAAGWDDNPMHRERSEAVAGAIKHTIPLNINMRALEFGAGTGTASFLLKDLLKEIVLMDTSREMVRIMNEKISLNKANNLIAMNFDLEKNEYTDGKFDLIFTQMALHHVADTDAIIKKFSRMLNQNGYLVIADLYEEDGSFHGDGFTGHRGFNIEALSGLLHKNNFSGITHKTCFAIEHRISESESKQFEVFLLTGKKSL